MTRINLVTHPEKVVTPKVWVNGKWDNVTNTTLVSTVNGEIDPTILPREARVANAPAYSPDLPWHSGDIVYRIGKLYRANSDIAEEVPFKVGTLANEWTQVSVTETMTNVLDWGTYNPTLDKPIKKGDMFYYAGDLYRAHNDNVGQEITSFAYFLRLTGHKRVLPFSNLKSYTPEDYIDWHGHIAYPNSGIQAGSSFEWGLSTNTWKPVLAQSLLFHNWKGVAPGTNTTYVIGDVIAISTTSSELYCCVENNTVFNNSGGNQLDMTRWVPVIDEAGRFAFGDYISKDHDIDIKPFSTTRNYKVGNIVSTDDGKSIWLCISPVTAGNPFNQVSWTSIGAGNLAPSGVVFTDGNGKLSVNTNVTPVELSHLDGVTSGIQTQINSKQDTITGAASSVVTSNLSSNSAVITDANGKLASLSNVSTTELGYIDGVTSNIQTQLNNKMDKTHVRFGFDLVHNTQPKAVFRDKFLTSGPNATNINSANVPWVYANIDQAERSLPYWIQQLATFFKNLENDKQFDQLIGGIPGNFSIPFGSWGVAPSSSTDMDNSVLQGAGNYASEVFEFIVGKNPSGTEIYTFQFTFTQQASSATGADVMYPFSMIYQTNRGSNNNWSSTPVSSIANSIPRCTARPSSFTLGSYNTSAFPLMYEPITLEISK